MKKPRLWKYKTGAKAGHLRQASKDYLSFKLKEYWKTPEALERKITVAPPLPPKKYIRVWAKWTYLKDKPLVLEAFIDGRTTNETELRERLWEFIASNFGDTVADYCEYGIEEIPKAFYSHPNLNFKRSLGAIWQKL